MADPLPDNPHAPNEHTDHESVLMPEPTAAPLVLALGLALMALGIAFGLAFTAVGVVLLAIGLGQWIAHLLPGKGHMHEPLAPLEERPTPIHGRTGAVAQLHPGAPGYRFRLPEKVHPISAGIKGGIAGGILMPIPALTYGVLSNHGIWYPINLLSGMVLPGMGEMTVAELEQFRPDLLVTSSIIHVIISLTVGLIYGVLMPTLPSIPKPLAWGGLLMPILWTGVTYATMSLVNPLLAEGVDWPWFIVSQFIFGVIAALVVQYNERRNPLVAGLLGGFIGGLLMPIPALLWALSTRHSIWYPANLLAGMVHPELKEMPLVELELYRPDWLGTAIALHIVFTLVFGLVYGALLPRVKAIPAPLAWGGLVLPLLWTGMSYGLMGIVNPTLADKIDWPWFIVSQFIFGLVASIVVVRSEMVHIAPAGPGSEEPQMDNAQ